MQTKFKVSEVKVTYKNLVPKSDRTVVKNRAILITLLRNAMDEHIEHYEAFYVIYLNTAMEVLSLDKLAQGAISGCQIDVRLILQRALLLNSTRIVCGHNHPSGNVKVSESDKKVNRKLKSACKILDIDLVDNLVITSTDFQEI